MGIEELQVILTDRLRKISFIVCILNIILHSTYRMHLKREINSPFDPIYIDIYLTFNRA